MRWPVPKIDQNAQSLIQFLNKIKNEANPAESQHIVEIVDDLQKGITQTDEKKKASLIENAFNKSKMLNTILKTSENLVKYSASFGTLIVKLFGL
ncbi:MAG: hypothetical protein JKY19_04190 [Alcanivoracaceae bacterium]|nr:hypothetical protein [Alcanivoracaceae bacterium]